jgi:uncharacterized protein (TIGR02266 family)
MAEKRSEKRIPIMMWVEEVRDKETYFQRTGNLSVGGLYLDGTIPHPKGTLVRLTFTLPNEDAAMTVKGEIVGDPDEEHLGMHVRFVDLADDSRARVQAFIDSVERH